MPNGSSRRCRISPPTRSDIRLRRAARAGRTAARNGVLLTVRDTGPGFRRSTSTRLRSLLQSGRVASTDRGTPPAAASASRSSEAIVERHGGPSPRRMRRTAEPSSRSACRVRFRYHLPDTHEIACILLAIGCVDRSPGNGRRAAAPGPCRSRCRWCGRGDRAYLASVPADARARSDAYFEGGYWVSLWQFLWSSNRPDCSCSTPACPPGFAIWLRASPVSGGCSRRSTGLVFS